MTEAIEAQVDEQVDDVQETQETVENEVEETSVNDETFPREYVDKLRAENAENRVKAKRADDLAHRLHTALVTATGRLQDPSDLPFDESHLESDEALAEAIDALLDSKPHLATRKPAGDIGQGHYSENRDPVNLAAMLRSNL